MKTQRNRLYEAPKAEALTLNIEKMVCDSNQSNAPAARVDYGTEYSLDD